MKKLFLILLLALSLGCKKELSEDSSNVLQFDTFTLKAPSEWRQYSAQGYDSKIGGIIKGADTLRYDYGWYSYPLSTETEKTHIRTSTKIDGREALIVRPKKRGEGLIGVLITVDDMNKLSFCGKSMDEEEVLRIYNSIRF
jgi:hypothetical protein